MDDAKYKLSLSGGGLKFDHEVDQATARAVLNLVLGGGSPPRAPDSHQRAPANGEEAGLRIDASHPRGNNLSVGEFIAQVAARRNPDKIVAIGAYLKQEGKSEFTAEDIKPMFQQAGESTPGNFARDWRWAQTAKWIAPVGGRGKSFYVTNTGLKAVEAQFPPELRKQTAQPSGRKTRRKLGGTE